MRPRIAQPGLGYADWNQNDVILITTKARLSLLCQQANHLKRNPVQPDRLAQRVILRRPTDKVSEFSQLPSCPPNTSKGKAAIASDRPAYNSVSPNACPRLRRATTAAPILSKNNQRVGIIFIQTRIPVSQAEFLQSLFQETILPAAIALLVAGVITGLLFGFLMARGLTRRLRALDHAADAWSQGHFSVLAPDRSGDELGHLARHLNHMAIQLENLLHTRQELATPQGTGLTSALRNHVANWSRQTYIQADIRVRGKRPLPLPVEQTLFRVAQEALANIARHSQAKTATVDLAWEKQRVTLTISDDGRGIKKQASNGIGIGLQSMRERMESLGGSLTISSQPGQETRVIARPNIRMGD